MFDTTTASDNHLRFRKKFLEIIKQLIMAIEDNIRNAIHVVFLEETRFPRQAQCFLKFLQFKLEQQILVQNIT